MKILQSKIKCDSNGFTLVELMVTLVISGFISGGIFIAFTAQNKSYIAQEQVSMMQQNLRAGMVMLTTELRMAGYDPNGIMDPLNPAQAPITATASNSITFRMDDPANPGTIKSLTYNVADTDGDGDSDLIRSVNGGAGSILMENVEGLEFFYTLADGTTTLAPADVFDIRTIDITVLVRAERQDQNLVNNQAYQHPGGVPWAVNDKYRRRILRATVKSRNMGMI